MKSGLRIAVVVAAATATSATAYAFSEPRKNENELVCKKTTQAASRFQHRLCFTRGQWDRISEFNKRAWGDLRDRPAFETRR